MPFPRRTPDQPAEDPTEMLRAWRDRQREETLADTRVFDVVVPAAPAATRRRRGALVLAAGTGALVALGGVALASAVTQDSPRTGGVPASVVASPAPTTPTAPTASTDGTDTMPAGPGGGDRPAPPSGGRPGPADGGPVGPEPG